jgi:hypothetical protein
MISGRSRLPNDTLKTPGLSKLSQVSALPQREQNPRVALADERYSVGAPFVHAKVSGVKPTEVKNAAPDILRHLPQWQCITHRGSSVAR